MSFGLWGRADERRERNANPAGAVVRQRRCGTSCAVAERIRMNHLSEEVCSWHTRDTGFVSPAPDFLCRRIIQCLRFIFLWSRKVYGSLDAGDGVPVIVISSRCFEFFGRMIISFLRLSACWFNNMAFNCLLGLLALAVSSSGYFANPVCKIVNIDNYSNTNMFLNVPPPWPDLLRAH